MLQIERSQIESLGFDFELALQVFSEAKAQHPFTVDVPAPTSHPLVEAAYEAGGYEIVDPPPPPPPPEPPPANPLKEQALQRILALEGQSVENQLAEIRALLTEVFENMPG